MNTQELASQKAFRTTTLSIVYRPLASLQPDPRNARIHPRRQLAQIRASIEAFGFTNPILADEAGMIIAGHGRLLAARELGMAEVPVIVLAGLDDARKRALRIADNKIALNAGWDLEILRIELAELSSIDVGIDPALTEPHWVCRRPFGLSYAAMAGWSSSAGGISPIGRIRRR